MRAYRGVLKEKEALEATVKALSVNHHEDTQAQETDGTSCPTDNETDSEAVRSEVGDSVRSDLSEGGDVSDSGTEGGCVKSVTPVVSPSGMVNW